MIEVFGIVAAFFGAILFVVATFLLAEVLASFGAKTPAAPAARARGPIAVIIPAHNEQGIVAATVAACRVGLRDIDRVIVVADNCDDETAAKARPAGADAIERRDSVKCGKGYALQFGVDHLRSSPPETVVFIDADCKPQPGAIARIAERAALLNRPVQALYLMEPPADADAKSRVSAFAWMLMNRVRMSGLQELAGVTRLTGSGMAFPWRLIERAELASGEIVEDLALTIRMVEDGAAPLLDAGAVVTSELAASERGATTQRARWEHGSIRMALRTAPRLFLKGLSGDFKSLALALDIATPPLTVFGAIIATALVAGVVLALLGAAALLKFAILAGAFFSAAIIGAWSVYGRDLLPPKEIRGVGAYLAGKVRVYGAEGRKSAARWTRTDRGGS